MLLTNARRLGLSTALCLSVAASSGCKKGDGAAASASASSSAAPAPSAAPAATSKAASVPVGNFDVAFKGTYQKTAKVAFKNGARIRTETGKGTATLTIEPGKVTYHVEYPSKGGTAHVTEAYTYAQSDVRPVADGFDVNLTFQTMDSDQGSGYNPDSKEPKIEARKQAGGWEIGFLYHDTGGIQAGMEFH